MCCINHYDDLDTASDDGNDVDEDVDDGNDDVIHDDVFKHICFFIPFNT